jgi:hypothetical protein
MFLGQLGKLKVITIHNRNSKTGSAESNFCSAIANQPENLDLLLQLISNTDKIFASYAWDLLMRLPVNKKTVDVIRGLKFTKTLEGW